MGSDRPQNIGQPFPRIGPSVFAGSKKAVHHRRALSAWMGASKQIILAAQGQWTDGVLDKVIIDFDTAIIQVMFQLGPLVLA
jgi:hypothetical protein